MRFALLGGHPDGVEMACALAQSGRHKLVACTSPADEALLQWADGVQIVSDVEEILSDPAVELVIVAGEPGVRGEQLRRALQSERPILCVHPPAGSPETAYEAAMLQADTAGVLLPLLPEATHPGIQRLGELIRGQGAEPLSALGAVRLIEFQRSSPGQLLDGIELPGHKPSFPGWDILRTLGGEIEEVSVFAATDELRGGEPFLLAGRFAGGSLFQMTLLPLEAQASWRLTVHGFGGQAELYWPDGWLGPAFLSWRDPAGELHEESWPTWDPWPYLVRKIEAALKPGSSAAAPPLCLSWQDTIQALELDDAARRSVERRRTSMLEYPEANEEVGFKGTMTLAGCGILWGMLLLLIASRWLPALGWVIFPLLVLFLALQLLRYLIPKPKQTPENEGEQAGNGEQRSTPN